MALVEFTQRGSRLFRNSVGSAWTGGVITDKPTAKGRVITLLGAQLIAFGLLVRSATKGKTHGGGSDLLGWTPHVVTLEDVGRTLAIFTAAEVKTDAYQTVTPDQRNFLDAVVRAGGLGFVVREDGDGVRVVEWPEEAAGRATGRGKKSLDKV
jgi:hypothetical protein